MTRSRFAHVDPSHRGHDRSGTGVSNHLEGVGDTETTYPALTFVPWQWAHRGHLLESLVMSRYSRPSTLVGVTLATAALIGGIAIVASSGGTTGRVPTTDPQTTPALIGVATRFNQDYAANRAGLVYDRWDSQSQAIISRAQYVMRHVECPTSPGPAIVEGASRATKGFWRVDYSISGVQLVDYWHYQRGRWRFNIGLSNPDAAKLYRLAFHAYAKSVGCRH